jgi:thiamine kinase-like enzyme
LIFKKIKNPVSLEQRQSSKKVNIQTLALCHGDAHASFSLHPLCIS